MFLFFSQKKQLYFCRSNSKTLLYIAVTQVVLSNPEKFTQNWIYKQTGRKRSRKKNKPDLPNRVVLCVFVFLKPIILHGMYVLKFRKKGENLLV